MDNESLYFYSIFDNRHESDNNTRWQFGDNTTFFNDDAAGEDLDYGYPSFGNSICK